MNMLLDTHVFRIRQFELHKNASYMVKLSLFIAMITSVKRLANSSTHRVWLKHVWNPQGTWTRIHGTIKWFLKWKC